MENSIGARYEDSFCHVFRPHGRSTSNGRAAGSEADPGCLQGGAEGMISAEN